MNVDIHGAKILFTLHVTDSININITSSIVITWGLMIVLTALAAWATHDLKVKNISKKQAAVEWIYNFIYTMVDQNMGQKWIKMVPFVGTILLGSLTMSLSSLLGFYPPTGDFMTIFAWAITVFVIITRTKIKSQGLGSYLKGFLDPIFIMAPINVMSECFTPISMTFRHFGNVLSGVIITSLIYSALGALNSALFGLIPGAAGTLLSVTPIFELGVPAVMSLYFDWFSGAIQAYIFCMLTMIFIHQADGE